nr:MAG TPA: hypothetical protein [Caudoviricetes sp.]
MSAKCPWPDSVKRLRIANLGGRRPRKGSGRVSLYPKGAEGYRAPNSQNLSFKVFRA